jgi:hypothetical protein
MQRDEFAASLGKSARHTREIAELIDGLIDYIALCWRAQLEAKRTGPEPVVRRKYAAAAKIMNIRGSVRHFRLAQELAAAHHGLSWETIADAWKKHKPRRYKRLTP